MATKRFPITHKEFKEFLRKRKAPLKFKGNAHCPIAFAINKKLGPKRVDHIGVGMTITSVRLVGSETSQTYVTPKWADKFVAEYDSYPEEFGLKLAKKVARV